MKNIRLDSKKKGKKPQEIANIMYFL